jgi:hypothetical protein
MVKFIAVGRMAPFTRVGPNKEKFARMSRRSSSRLSLANKDPVIDVGDRVFLISNNSQGTVRFSGPTEFAGGHWIGIELDEPTGKNDGCVQDIRYFECKMDHGIFVRAAQLKVSMTHLRIMDQLYQELIQESSRSSSPLRQSSLVFYFDSGTDISKRHTKTNFNFWNSRTHQPII